MFKTPVLEVVNLQKLYKNKRGVKNISFALYPGDVFGLLGSNGSGKTTAIKCICGLCPFKGDIRLFGESVSDNPRAALLKTGCIVETPSFYGNLSAYKNLLLAAQYYGMTKTGAAEAAGRALEAVGLDKFKRERAERFSLGMKARLGLALCFVSEPEFMALDEPLNGLDIEGMVEIRNIILRQAAVTGAVFLISSHLAAEVEKTCNRVGVMDEGELLETAAMDEVLGGYGSVENYYLSVLNRARGGPPVYGPSADGSSPNDPPPETPSVYGLSADGPSPNGPPADGSSSYNFLKSESPTGNSPVGDSLVGDSPAGDSPTCDSPTCDSPTGD